MRTTDPREPDALREQALGLLHQFEPIDLQTNELRALIAVLQPIARRVKVASVPRRLRAVEAETEGDDAALIGAKRCLASHGSNRQQRRRQAVCQRADTTGGERRWQVATLER